MKKNILISLSLFLLPVLTHAVDKPVYSSFKKDEEIVLKLFEHTRRVDVDTYFDMWRQDVLKLVTISCASKANVIKTEKNLIFRDEDYSPILRKEDIAYLNRLNIKSGSFADFDVKFCKKIAETPTDKLFEQCYIANIPSGNTILQNTGYPRNYLVVNSQFRDGEKIDVGVYCNAISGDPQTKQFFATKGLATWINPPKYQKVQFSNWSENLMLGSVKVLVDGIKEPYIFTTIFK